MRLAGRKRLVAFERKHTDVRGAVRAWVAEVEAAAWQSMQDIKERYPHASVITGERVVFKLKGNKYRLDAGVHFATQVVIVRRVGTHAEYDGWKF